MIHLSEFQQRGLREVRNTLTPHGLAGVNPEYEGEHETYVVFRFECKGVQYKIFVYEDGAGFFVDERWMPFECCDFPSESALLKSFLTALGSSLDRQGGRTEDDCGVE